MSAELKDGLRGRMAEYLVEHIFCHSNYRVRLFPWWKTATEKTIVSRAYAPEDFDNDEPDLLISRAKKVEYIEVKFRSSGRLHQDDLCHADNWRRWNGKYKLSIVIVSRFNSPYFRILSAPYFDEDGNQLVTVPMLDAGWKINKEVYRQWEQMIADGLFYLGKS